MDAARSYVYSVLEVEAWKRQAEDLLAAAAAVKPKVDQFWTTVEASVHGGRWSAESEEGFPRDLMGPYYMLVAYVLENLFKAAIVMRNRDTMRGLVLVAGGKLPKWFLQHHLVKLAIMAGHNLEPGDEDLLERLSHHSTWAGRYPVPPNCGERRTKVYSDSKTHLLHLHDADDLNKLDGLVRRVKCLAGDE